MQLNTKTHVFDPNSGIYYSMLIKKNYTLTELLFHTEEIGASFIHFDLGIREL